MSYLDREITPSTCTIFPIGAKVKITNSGRCYSTYKQMSEYMGITHKHAFNPFRNGEVGTVVAKAMHESTHYDGEVLAVRVAEGVALIGASGVTEHEEPAVIGKPKLPNYNLAPLTPEAFPRLAPYFAKAPSWATHVGSDDCGVHFFDHHPHVFNGGARFGCAFLKGLLPNTHRHLDAHNSDEDTTETLQVLVIPQVPKVVVVEPTVEQLKTELAAVKAKLWEAEWKLTKIVEVAEKGIL